MTVQSTSANLSSSNIRLVINTRTVIRMKELILKSDQQLIGYIDQIFQLVVSRVVVI